MPTQQAVSLELEAAIGRGAVGTVYRAQMHVGDRAQRVAVKVLLHSPQRDLFLSRIRDEARLLAMLDDPRILRVVDLIDMDGQDAVIMEHVQGVDGDKLQTTSIPPKTLAELGAQVAHALHVAHTATDPNTGEGLGVVHRDVKPANMMVTMEGQLKLLDFGVARAAFAARESYTGQMVVGTLNYMAPEYIVTGEVDSKADVFGLGLALWELALGRPYGQPKVRRDTHEARLADRLSQLPDQHGWMREHLQRMLAWDPQMRPTCAEVAQQLETHAETLPGDGLVAWAPDAVSTLYQNRDPIEDPLELVGRTIDVKVAEETPAIFEDTTLDEVQTPPPGLMPEAPTDEQPLPTPVEPTPNKPSPQTPSLVAFVLRGLALGGALGMLMISTIVAFLLFRGT